MYGEASISCSIWQPDIVWYGGVWECIKNRKERCFLSSWKGNRCKTGISSQVSVFF
ncbi:hypothetical protein HMPREF9406_3679 [Clostridium sp. HGF2]|nr:hypothetical protein HMPREF9406_3679 [Clostridium sp. HGF2]